LKSGKNGRGARRPPPRHLAPQERVQRRAGSLRIIGGRWRGRKIRFPAATELRPTPDRVRETLYNWLSAALSGARVLDAFAGSGALGLEALSRGAASALFIESDRRVARQLTQTLAELGATTGRVLCADTHVYLDTPATDRFDLVLLDPPFRDGRLPELCTLLETRGWLAPRAWVYLEHAAADSAAPLPEHWERWRETRAGAVLSTLVRRWTGEADLAPGSTPRA
jgi:16S rRNA (guanine966-N2)-methyltransferase